MESKQLVNTSTLAKRVGRSRRLDNITHLLEAIIITRGRRKKKIVKCFSSFVLSESETIYKQGLKVTFEIIFSIFDIPVITFPEGVL